MKSENEKYKLVFQVFGVLNCLEGNTMSNPVHTSETRMCGD